MYLISNQQHDDVVEMLTDYVSTGSRDDDLRKQNRRRRARLFLKALMKRKPIGKEIINIINTKNK